MYSEIVADLEKLGNPEKARLISSFFKTGEGQYGEGDVFLGITVPEQRTVAKRYLDIGIEDLKQLLASKIHEHRLVALMILVEKFRKASEPERKQIYSFYLGSTKYVNNWDLVDLTADRIVGEFLVDKNKAILRRLSKSGNLWERRIAVVSTFAFIRRNQLDQTFELAEKLMQDKHDLIHKAVGWMLREAGKKNQHALEKFLKRQCRHMPRTMLRYSLEKFPESKRKFYMKRE